MNKQPAHDNAYYAPAGWLYKIIAGLGWLLAVTLFGVRIRRDPRLAKIVGPLIILSNHPSYLDPIVTAMAFPKKKIHFLTTDYFFRNTISRWILTRVAAIPKVQFRADMQATRRMLQVIRHGGVLAVYPEGQRSLDGGQCPIDDAIAKLIKRTGCPVAVVNERGAYLTWPRWSQSGFRPGRIEAVVSLLYERHDLEGLTVSQIKRGIEKALAFNDYRWQRKRKATFLTLAPARGLHNLCHQCPSCRKILAMQSGRTRLTCRFCGYQAIVDASGFLRPSRKDQIFAKSDPTPADPWRWHRWQLQETRSRMSASDFLLSFPADADLLENDGRIIPAGQGILRLTNDCLEFDGDDCDDAGVPKLQIRLPYRHRIGLSFDFGFQFELAVRDQTYRFKPEPGQAVVLIVDALLAAGQDDSA